MTIYCKIAKWITDLLINIGAFYWHDYCHHCPKLLVFNGVITEEGMAHFGGNVIKEISQQLNCSAQKWWFLTTAGEDIFPLKKMSYYFHKSPLATLVIDLAFWWYPFSRGLGIITAKWCAANYGLFGHSWWNPEDAKISMIQPKHLSDQKLTAFGTQELKFYCE